MIYRYITTNYRYVSICAICGSNFQMVFYFFLCFCKISQHNTNNKNNNKNNKRRRTTTTTTLVTTTFKLINLDARGENKILKIH